MSSAVLFSRCARLTASIACKRWITTTRPAYAGVIRATNVAVSATDEGPPPVPEPQASPSPSSPTQHQQQEQQQGDETPAQNNASTTPYQTSDDSEAAILSSGDVDVNVDMEYMRDLGSKKPTPLRLRDMYRYASFDDPHQRLLNAQFLFTEIPIRMAQRAVDLLTLPYGLNQSTPIKNVAYIYIRYLNKFRDIAHAPTNAEEEQAFTDLLHSLVLDRTSIPTEIARGMNVWRETQQEELDATRLQALEDALYRFFTARVGLRFLTEHHILSSPYLSQTSALRDRHISRANNLGCIQTNCDPVHQVTTVAAQVTRQTETYFGICPEIDIVDCSPPTATDFTYVPHHLQYMLAELLKNSCRATVKRYLAEEIAHDGSGDKPKMGPIRVVVAKGAEDVSIKIADNGGGVPRSIMKQIFSFAHSTTESQESQTDFGTDELTGGAIRGFGLPLARIYARYFGGELTLKSMEGYGLDAYLYLPRLGDSCENLPASVMSSPGDRDSTPFRGDRL